MNRTQTTADDRLTALRSAPHGRCGAAIDLVGIGGDQILSRPVYIAAQSTLSDVEQIYGILRAGQFELGARHAAHDYTHQAREDGHSWHQIGQALDLTPSGDPDLESVTLAEAAYTYAPGNSGTEPALRCGRSLTWTCNSCGHTINDQGTLNRPTDDERGHAGNCSPLSATISAWEGEWEAGQ